MDESDPRLSGMFELDPGPAPLDPPPPVQPIGVYGWRKRCLYASVLALLVSVVVNLALTIWILRVLSFSMDGVGKLKIGPNGFILGGEAEFLKTVYAEKLQSKKEKPLYVQSNREVRFISSDKNGTKSSQFVVDQDYIEARCHTFEVKDHQNQTLMQLTGSKVYFSNPDASVPGDLQFKGSVSTPNVQGHPDQPLNILSQTSKVRIEGLKGVSVESTQGNVEFEAGNDITIKTRNKGQVKIDSQELYLSNMPAINMNNTPVDRSAPSHVVYQLCLCESGRLFLGLPKDKCKVSSGFC